MKIPQVEFVKSLAASKDRPGPELPEIAMVGRSNVGKSSLINSLFNRRHLAKTSAKPGKTRLINYFLVEDYLYLVDLPGYGFTRLPKEVTRSWENLITGYLQSNPNLKWVCLLIDSRHDLMDIDRKMINWLTRAAIPFVLVMTKCDKLSNNALAGQVKKINRELAVVTIIPYSSKTHQGREEILQMFEEFK